MNGRKHSQGGIDIGPSNKTGIEVEDGEVIETNGNELKVYSAQPILNGASPAQLVMGGANPNKIFKAQEDFKDKIELMMMELNIKKVAKFIKHLMNIKDKSLKVVR